MTSRLAIRTVGGGRARPLLHLDRRALLHPLSSSSPVFYPGRAARRSAFVPRLPVIPEHAEALVPSARLQLPRSA